MSLEDDLLEQRIRRISEIEALGFRAYGQRFDFTHTIPQILATEGARTAEALDAEKPRVKIAGRIQTVRRMGKAGFMHLAQSGERLQVYVRKDAVSEREYTLYNLLDLGDIIGVEGYLFRTRTGELSVHAERLMFLSKILLNMPEKFHGLEDVEIRYRQRYLDLIANPESQRIFATRARIIASFRRQLEQRGFIEVETPMMQPLYGGATARPFVTHHNTLDMDLYLRIAPELYLKRLVVGGLERVYEINRNFRNEGISTQHNPEFTMLEFYEAYSDYRVFMDLTEELFATVAKAVAGDTKVKFGDHEIDFAKWQRLTMREAIVQYWPKGAPRLELSEFGNFEEFLSKVKATLKYCADVQFWPFADGTILVELAKGIATLKDLNLSPKEAIGFMTGELFEALAEDDLIQPTMIYDFPVEISPLSKCRDDDPSTAERFEVFIGGLELGNAFSELNDPVEQEKRFRAQVAQGGEEAPKEVDMDYVRALSHAMPPAAGMGIGIDRITMLLTDSHSIRDVILFPLLRPEAQHERADSATGTP